MLTKPTSPERGPLSPDTSPKILLVEQPKSARLDSLLAEIEQITELPAKGISEDRPSGTGAASSQAISPREAAIAALPDLPVMQGALTGHIEQEINVLRKEAQRVTRLGRSGHAHRLNEIYRKIRQLQSLLLTLLESSYEILRRLYVRIIIDRQPIL